MVGIRERNQRKDVIPVMLLTTKYISYVSAKSTTF